MILSDFEPCFRVSAHRYRYNAALSYSIIRRGQGALQQPPKDGAEGPWEVFAHDSRLPGSGWAYLESRVRGRVACGRAHDR